MIGRENRSGQHSRVSARTPLNVLVVDDSAVVRQVLTSILSADKGLKVTVAADPLIAMSKMKKLRFDVIVLDLEMPRMNGMTFLHKIMAEDPIPVVVCSGLAGPGTDTALQALEKGAVAIVTKPKLQVRGFLEESAVILIDTIRGAAQARLRKCFPSPRETHERYTADVVLPRVATPPLLITAEKVVAIGSSTGGTEALRLILGTMPADAPGIVIVQHMPEVFTLAFAKRLNESCALAVKEAENGDAVMQGRVLIAPGNRHTMLRRSGANYIVEVTDGPLVSRHRPSVDVLFRSVAQSAGPNAVGVILTGMGDDGASGLLEMKTAGAATIAQNEATCVVYGMPKEAIAHGAVDEVIPLPQISAAILARIRLILRTASRQ